MNPQTPTPPSGRPNEAGPGPGTPEADPRSEQRAELDRELDQELDDTFPASDPLPWSHEVK
jgi:hypothetical protein